MSRTHPAQALDQLAGLIDRYQTPTYQQYCTLYVATTLRTHQAGRAVASWEDADGPILPRDLNRGVGFVEQQLATLRAAETYHVAEEMTPLIGWMAGKLRGVDRLEPHHLPSQVGFVWFDRPLAMRDAGGADMRIRALTWQHGVHDDVAGIRLVHYSDPTVSGTAWHPEKKLELDEQLDLFGRLIVDHFEFLPYGMRVGPPNLAPVIEEAGLAPDGWGTSYVDNHRRLLLAYLMLLGQKIVKTEPTQARAGSSFRRKRRMNIPDRVQVVALREVVYPKREEGAGVDVEWQHRWPVKAHPHLYWTGKGRTVPVVLMVGPYLKGPEGAPIRVTDKVYSLKR